MNTLHFYIHIHPRVILLEAIGQLCGYEVRNNTFQVRTRQYCKSKNFGGYKIWLSQNKVIWRLLNLASPRGPSMQCHPELSGCITTLTVVIHGGCKLLCCNGHIDRSRWCSVRSTYMLVATDNSKNTQFAKFAKYNSTPKFADLQ